MCRRRKRGRSRSAAEVDELGGVDAELKQALREGAARLNEVVAQLRRRRIDGILR